MTEKTPPYPADLEAKGWSLDLDYERIEQSDTWAIALPEQRPWLLMLWLVSWRQVPVASLPISHKLIAARLGMPEAKFSEWADVLLSGWEMASDGRMYHKTLTDHVLRMANKRVKDRERVHNFRLRSRVNNGGFAACNVLPTHELHVSSAPTPTPTPTPLIQEPTVLVPEPLAQAHERLPPCPTQELVDLYHHHLPMLPRVEVLNDGRRRALSARWREVVTDKDIAKTESPKSAAVDFFGWYFGHASRSAFLTGRAKNWRADFDFLITPSKFAKVIEGHYHKDTV